MMATEVEGQGYAAPALHYYFYTPRYHVPAAEAAPSALPGPPLNAIPKLRMRVRRRS
jgi:hypothetical protein